MLYNIKPYFCTVFFMVLDFKVNEDWESVKIPFFRINDCLQSCIITFSYYFYPRQKLKTVGESLDCG